MTRRRAAHWILVTMVVMAGALSTAAAQDETGPEPRIQKVIRLSHISVDEARSVIAPLASPDVAWSFVPELNIVSVRARASKIEEIESLLKEVDVPKTAVESPNLNVVLTGYFLGASDAQQGNVPEQVRDAVTEIRRHFPYKNYTLLETFGIRTQVGTRGHLSGLTLTDPNLPPMRYEVNIQVGEVSGDPTNRVVHIRDLQTEWRYPVETKPGEPHYEAPGVRASLNIAEGVTVVVGKSGVVGAYQGIFLLLKAEVVDP